ncbi:radical SAM family heme chaperone HemW [Desulfoplanes formicivorans]|uniref:Heme chaperone HemW n=1 Tax=Desulfoplanes formicivorans TaxID=1592317 RepID=A0A194AFF1_9BACT|nr:radical SAM family heme chaperone HemW [Desulfoplanes formicivorans]GAU07925.1 coproporphyrinogen III oxidase [Desulfoplanes formicivorans]
MLLYIHVPFCRRKCRYCAFASGPYSRKGMQTYVDLLLQELCFWSERLEHPTIETIYFGGGTPSLLWAQDIERILTTIFMRFQVLPGAEITLEANPESANDTTYLQSLHDLGVNRLNVGVQSLDSHLLAILGRLHTPDQAIQTLDKARTAGFTNIGLDFIWGIPGQSLNQWLDQLETIARLKPDHLSCYGLTIEPGTPLERDIQAEKIMLPAEDTQSAMFLEGSALLGAHGYDHYEISNFCLPDRHSHHNTGYWQGMDYLGVGPAAVSTISHNRWTHPHDLESYALSLQNRQLGANREVLAGSTLTNEQIMLSLRTSKGLGLDLLRAHRSEQEAQQLDCLIESLCQHGLATIKDAFLGLTPEGMLVSNTIISEFLIQEAN